MTRALRLALGIYAFVAWACHASTPPPPARVAPAPLAPVRVWSNRALRERCEQPPPAPTVAASSAPVAPDSSSTPPRRVELPPTLARYPLLGRLSTGCGSPTLYTYCSMAGPPYPWPRVDPPLRPSAPLVMMFGDAHDCVTRNALESSLDRDALVACFDAASLPCVDWHWVSASIRVDRPHDGRLTAMTGHEGVSVRTAECLARAFRATRWVDHEGDAPVIVNVAISWIDQACLR